MASVTGSLLAPSFPLWPVSLQLLKSICEEER